MTASSIDKQAQKIKKLRQLQRKSPTRSYILNVLLPGVGNVLFGGVKTGIVLIIASLIALFMLLAGAASFQLGLLVTAVSVVGALFTVGLSLILLPFGIFLMFFGAGGPLIALLLYLTALIVSEYLVHKTVQDLADLPPAASPVLA